MHGFILKKNRLNNRDFNIDQNNNDYDVFQSSSCIVLYTFQK